MIVAERSAFPAIAKIFLGTPIAVWRDYLTVHYLHAFAAYLPKRFDNEDFRFYGTVLQGNATQLDRKTRAVHLLDGDYRRGAGQDLRRALFPAGSQGEGGGPRLQHP